MFISLALMPYLYEGLAHHLVILVILLQPLLVIFGLFTIAALSIYISTNSAQILPSSTSRHHFIFFITMLRGLSACSVSGPVLANQRVS